MVDEEKSQEQDSIVTLDYPEGEQEAAVLEEQPRSSFRSTAPPQNSFVTKGEKKTTRKGIVVKVPKKINWNPVKTNSNTDSTAR